MDMDRANWKLNEVNEKKDKYYLKDYTFEFWNNT